MNCDNHSLNLDGLHAATHDALTVIFFMLLSHFTHSFHILLSVGKS